MSVARPSRMEARVNILFHNIIVRYLFALATVASTFALRIWLTPFTGTGAPFVLFFAAVLVTSMVAGVGPGICALLISLPLAAYMFVTRAGYPPFQAAFQAMLFAIDGIVVIYLTYLMKKGRQVAQDASRQLRDANEEITRSMARTREVIELSPDAFFQADLDARLTDVNQAACRLLGYDRDELIGKTIFDIIPVEDAPRLKAVQAELLVPGQVNRAEWIQKRKDGTFVPVEVSSNILPDGRWQAFVRDISERKRIERALQESEERFRLTIDEAPIGMALVALDGHFVRVNRALCEILGYSSDELTGLTFQAITHPDDLDADLALAGQLARGEIPRYQLGKRYNRKDGTIVDILLSGSILRSRDGAPLYYIAQMEDVTERKRAEEALRRSESQYRGLIEHMPDGVFAYRSGRIVYANDAFVRLLGHDDRAAIVGQPIFELLHPDDHPAVADRIRAVQQTGLPATPKEFRMIGRDGSFRSVETVGLQAQFEGQSSIVVIVRDLTERKRAEEALRISEAKYSGIVSISADAIISIDDGQRITIFNDGAEKIFGYSKSEAIGAPLDILIPDRFRSAHRQHIERFAGGNEIARRMGERLTTIAGLRKNGEEFPAEAAISKLRVGEKTLLTVALRDITERKRIEKEQQFLAEAGAVLAASLDYEQTLVTVAQLVVRDFADWCIVEVMEEHEHLRRLKVVSADPTKAALCTHLEQIPIDRDRPYLIRAVIETQQSLLIEHVNSEHLESVAQGPEHLQALRAVSPKSLMALPLLMRGQLLGTLAFISSNPSRSYGLGDLRLAEALADRAAMAIENARLYRASVHATQLRDQVLGVVAHDLRNPLSTILTQVWALKRHGPEPERRSLKPGEVIQRAAKRMNRLIQDLLDVALMEEGQLTIERARLSAGGLIVEAADMQRPLASSSSLELRVDVEPDVPEIWGDRDRLLQVFENLIGNAIKFTKTGGRITAGTASRDEEVVFWVADTGCGIAFANLPRVFDRFWQAARTGRQGAGLGLPITKGIIEAHGGRIWVESTQGRGTTFSFTIPKASPA
jgi:PAS domain S-box-containing protein